MILATAAFVLGSGLSGGANTVPAMIASRVIQGIGGSGVSVLAEIIVSDLVPLRERGTYMAVVFGMVAVGAALGPLFGGLIASYSTWRWAFYMALPIGGPATVLLFVFLRVRFDRSAAWTAQVLQLDWLGGAVFIGGCSAVLTALSWAGIHYPWSSYKVLVPLIIGMVALMCFVAIEGTSFIKNPMVPLRFFRSSIVSIVFLITFLHGMVAMWGIYLLPVYFQGVLGVTPYHSGVNLLPTILVIIPGAIIGGMLLSKLGRYKPILLVAYAFIVVGNGLFTLLDENSTTAAWVGFQMISSFGTGLAMPALLPAMLAPLTDGDTALATGTWAFMRSFGTVWGVAIAGTVFSNRAEELARAGGIASNAMVAAQFAAGDSFQMATKTFLDSLSGETRTEVISLQSRALKRSWQVAVAFAGLGFVAALFLKEVPMRTELETDYGIADVEYQIEDVEMDVKVLSDSAQHVNNTDMI